MSYNKPYTKLNFLAFAFACFSTISFAVFLSSTQAFFLTDVLGVSTKIGDYVGTLGVADELLSMSVSPFLGALSDKIGAKYISVFGLFLMGVALMVYTLAKNVFPELLFFRLFFALGATAAASMMTAMLAELSASGFELKSMFRWNQQEEQDLEETSPDTANLADEDIPAKRNGKLTSVIGIATGCGAVFSVVVYLPLPAKFGEVEPPKQALKHSYIIVGGISILCSFVLSYGLFSSKRLRIPYLTKYLTPYDDVLEALEEEEAETARQEQDKSYLKLFKLGFEEAKNPKIALAYFGGFLARSTTVVTSVFIPLYVNNYYYKNGMCTSGDENTCRQAYMHAAILTGITNTVSLLFAPIFGYICDTYGRKNSMILTTICGITSTFGFAFVGNPRSALAIVMCCFFGAAQIGHIITSMSLCTDKHRTHNGAISGVYSLFGGLGILIISKIGGYSADYWMGAPFIILAGFNVGLLIATLYVGHKFDLILSRLTSVALPEDE
jgi:MFS family permease